ncbi:MAG: efflux RND transporter periplasmic adaptor subunit [Planctomycetes bacterium]|nr:efflux RND transporter periplasmic adaptor subunit [Planctomycetota bacterium]
MSFLRKTRIARPVYAALTALVMFSTFACEPGQTELAASAEHESGAADASTTNRIDIPPSVRQNLGITFVTVEKRPVRTTIRLPGQFELRPDARREYHVVLPGRIELLVEQYERVERDQPLFHLDSPDWLKLQSELVSARNAMKRSHADLAVEEARLAEAIKAIAFLEARRMNLAEAQVRQVALEADLAEKRNTLPRLRAELVAARAEFEAAHAHYDVMLSTASSFSGIDVQQLDPGRDEHGHGHLETGDPPWRSIHRLTIRADASGVVDRIAVTNQGWATTGGLVLDTIDPTALRFHGDAIQTDIQLFADGQRARIVPPQGGSIALQDTVDGVIEVGFQAHAQQRTIPIMLVPSTLPSWAKAGVTAYLEVYIAGHDGDVLAIPESAVIRDGLERVFFRRDPSNPNKVIRTVADLGVSDGRWVEVASGVMLGEEIVLGGVYPLMLASSSSGERQKGGHFHADGTFHQEDSD